MFWGIDCLKRGRGWWSVFNGWRFYLSVIIGDV